MKTLLVCVGVVLFSAGTVSAQHPCDALAPTTQTISSGAPHRAHFCARPADNPEAFTVYINGVASDLRPMTVVATANAQGWAAYEGPNELQFGNGSYVVEISLWNRVSPGGPSQEGGKSSPLSLSAVSDALPPAAPKVLGIIR